MCYETDDSQREKDVVHAAARGVSLRVHVICGFAKHPRSPPCSPRTAQHLADRATLVHDYATTGASGHATTILSAQEGCAIASIFVHPCLWFIYHYVPLKQQTSFPTHLILVQSQSSVVPSITIHSFIMMSAPNRA